MWIKSTSIYEVHCVFVLFIVSLFLHNLTHTCQLFAGLMAVPNGAVNLNNTVLHLQDDIISGDFDSFMNRFQNNNLSQHDIAHLTSLALGHASPALELLSPHCRKELHGPVELLHNHPIGQCLINFYLVVNNNHQQRQSFQLSVVSVINEGENVMSRILRAQHIYGYVDNVLYPTIYLMLGGQPIQPIQPPHPLQLVIGSCNLGFHLAANFSNSWGRILSEACKLCAGGLANTILTAYPATHVGAFNSEGMLPLHSLFHTFFDTRLIFRVLQAPTVDVTAVDVWNHSALWYSSLHNYTPIGDNYNPDFEHALSHLLHSLDAIHNYAVPRQIFRHAVMHSNNTNYMFVMIMLDFPNLCEVSADHIQHSIITNNPNLHARLVAHG